MTVFPAQDFSQVTAEAGALVDGVEETVGSGVEGALRLGVTWVPGGRGGGPSGRTANTAPVTATTASPNALARAAARRLARAPSEAMVAGVNAAGAASR
ncbi:MAG: hypothetical protein HOV79_08935 [Hamadaea sp.]|nr:hypothetical protein [Hamadaea sp.]